ncbi:MAG: hypothetical protein EP343_17910 [Deltaproteobacteria bacterium]|nr:MAG: hypothetical protein EP343_17910 [Deltaproteobacteria bacterium]
MRIVILLAVGALGVSLLTVPSLRKRWLPQTQHSWSKTKQKMSSHHSLLEKLPAKKLKPYPKGSFPQAPKAAKAEWVRVEWAHPRRSFFALPRTKALQRFPCSQCHDSTMKRGSMKRFRATHGSIQLQHATAGVLSCRSCHDVNNMNRLKTPTGLSVSFDQSHLLCGSCHSQQVKDWAGGAHGKRERFWQGVRVVRSCTGCHNPHKPKFGKRWPKAFFRIPKSRKAKSH